MKIKYIEILKANEPLSVLAKEKVSMKEAIGIARLIKSLRDEFSIYQEKEKELIDQYCQPSENGRYIYKDEESAKMFNEGYNELLEYEVDLAIEPVKIISDIKIDAESIINMEKFISFE